MLDPRARPSLELPRLLALLRDREVDWVLTGSLALAVYGAGIEPGDLDVVPSLEPANLRRLAGLLTEVEAIPAYGPGLSGLTEEECRAWRPEPPTAEQLDHLFVTRLGMLDVPPKLTGTYTGLLPGATRMDLAGVPVWVCDPDEVLRRLPAKPRPKEHARRHAYAALREQLRTDRRPHGLPRFAA
jgi:hypothetical protein